MAGHSKFKNIQHRKGAQDKKRAKVFTRLVREIITAAKMGGPDPASNPRLRTAISMAKSQNLPKERIDRALSQAADPQSSDNYSEMRYEAFMPGGIGLIIEALTDNKNRAVAEVRTIISKAGGNMGESGSVSFMFDKVGSLQYQAKDIDEDKIFDLALEAGALDIEIEDEICFIYSDPQEFLSVYEVMNEKIGAPLESGIIWQAQNHIEITDEEQASKLLKVIEKLEDLDDVQEVFGNYKL